MHLVDTSIWIDHFKRKRSALIPLLLEGQVVTHEFILGELCLGQFVARKNEIFERLLVLERIETSAHEEVLAFARQHHLAGKGIGWIDCHLLCAASKKGVKIFTLDNALDKLSRSTLR